MTGPNQRNNAEKIEIFREFFTGLTHSYGTYDPRTGKAFQVKKPVTEQVILAHLRGHQPYGIYLLVGDRTRAVVADFDSEDTWGPTQFVAAAAQYEIPAYIEVLINKCEDPIQDYMRRVVCKKLGVYSR